MTDIIPPDKTRLILVEGADDVEFFRRLIGIWEADPSLPLLVSDFAIMPFEGKDRLASFLYQLTQDSRFARLTHIGIVRDADYDTDAFASIVSAIQRVNRESKMTVLSPPPSMLQPSSTLPFVLPLTIPLFGDGSLESILADALRSDAVMSCVDQYFSCIESIDSASVAVNRLDKNRLRVFIAGKEVDRTQASHDDAKRNLLRNIYSMSWLPQDFWDHPAFDDARAFLRQLLSP